MEDKEKKKRQGHKRGVEKRGGEAGGKIGKW